MWLWVVDSCEINGSSITVAHIHKARKIMANGVSIFFFFFFFLLRTNGVSYEHNNNSQ